MSPVPQPNVELERQIATARNHAAEGARLAVEVKDDLAQYSAEVAQADALASIAFSLSAIATVLLATIDDEASR